MSVERTYHCDRDDCHCHARSTSGLPAGFLRVTGDGTLHFCGWDCLMQHAARFEPPTVIQMGDTERWMLGFGGENHEENP